MLRAIIASAIPVEIGAALWLAGPCEIASAALAVVAVLSILFVGDRYAKTENTEY
jgi:hypothetical protein